MHTTNGWPLQPRDQPPDHYRLLAVERFEPDAEVIETAANQRMAYLHGCSTSEHAELAERLLNEIAAARVCLLNAAKKAAYDDELRARGAHAALANNVPEPPVSAPTSSTPSAAATAPIVTPLPVAAVPTAAVLIQPPTHLPAAEAQQQAHAPAPIVTLRSPSIAALARRTPIWPLAVVRSARFLTVVIRSVIFGHYYETLAHDAATMVNLRAECA